jgi:hypothetical protein
MSSDQDQDKEKNSSKESEDTSEYYAQGDSKEHFDEESELTKPVPPVEKALEEMSLLKAVAYLGFGLASLAIVFILFFIRDLDNRVVGVDSALNILEDKIAPLRKEVKESLNQVNTDINGLKIKLEDTENRAAVMELKRALVAIQGMGLNENPEVETKSNEVVASIQALLSEFGAGNIPFDPNPSQLARPVGEVIVKEVPDPIELPTVEKANEVDIAPPTEENIREASSELVVEQESLPQQTEELEESVEDNSEPNINEEGEDEDEDEDDDEE